MLVCKRDFDFIACCPWLLSILIVDLLVGFYATFGFIFLRNTDTQVVADDLIVNQFLTVAMGNNQSECLNASVILILSVLVHGNSQIWL